MIKGLTAVALGILLAASTTYSSAVNLIGLDHYAITVTDLQRSASWYQRVLGFAVLHKWSTTWMVGKDNIKVGLFLRPKGKPIDDIDNTIAIQHVAFLIDGDKFSDAQAQFKALGVPFEGPEDTGIAYSIFFKDPDGHLLEITTYHPTPTATSLSAAVPASAQPNP